MARFNGFRNRETHTVCMWISNDNSLYSLALKAKKKSKNKKMAAMILRQEIEKAAPSIGGLFEALISNSLDVTDWEEITEKVG